MSCNVTNVEVNDSTSDILQDVSSDIMMNTATASETDSNWALVTRKKSQKSYKRVRNDSSSGNSRYSIAGSQPVTNVIQWQQYQKNQKVHGNRDDKDSVFKAGVKITKKSVVHIDNVSSECTEALLKGYLLSANVPVARICIRIFYVNESFLPGIVWISQMMMCSLLLPLKDW